MAAKGKGDAKSPQMVRAAAEEIGVHGARLYSGQVGDEFIQELGGWAGRRTFRQMRDNDSSIGGIFYAMENLARGVTWRVEASDDATDEDVELMESIFLGEDMTHTWDHFLAETFSTLTYGWSYFEVTYKRRDPRLHYTLREDGGTIGGTAPELPSVRIPMSRFDDGAIGIKNISLRPQDTLWRWLHTKRGDLLGMQQSHPTTGEVFTIPITKSLHLVSKLNKGNPEGYSILRNAYRDWYFKRRLEQIEADGIDRDLTGLPVVRIPSAVINDAADGNPVAQETLRTFQDMAQSIRMNQTAGCVIPSDMWLDAAGNPTQNRKVDLELLASPGQRVLDIDSAIQRYDRGIARAVLADFMMIGGDQHGNFSLSKNLSSLFITALTSFLDNVEQSINKQIIPTLWRLNGIKRKPPVLRHGLIVQNDLEVLGAYLRDVVGVGAISLPDKNLENKLRDAAGLPELPDDEERERDQIERGRVEAKIEGMKAKATGANKPGAQGGAAGGKGRTNQSNSKGGGMKPPTTGGGGSKAQPQATPQAKFSGRSTAGQHGSPGSSKPGQPAVSQRARPRKSR